MTKAEINKYIVLTRQLVRRAKICTIRKLIREAKMLRSKHGTKKQMEKCKRRAEKLILELGSLKTINNDDISKFGIIHENDLDTLCQSSQVDDATRVMAKVAKFKVLRNSIVILKEKFPDCGDQISLSKGNTIRVAKPKGLKTQAEDAQNKKTKHEGKSSSTVEKTEKVKVVSPNHLQGDEAIQKINVAKQSSEVPQDYTFDEQIRVNQEDCVKSLNIRPTLEKEMDDFFMTGNDNTPYHSIAVEAVDSDSDSSTSLKASHYGDQNRRNKIQSFSNIRKELKHKNRSVHYKNIALMEKSVSSETASKNNSFSAKYKKRNDPLDLSNNFIGKTKNENLHPSWVARKKEREMMSQGFQGKKIIFDDD